MFLDIARVQDLYYNTISGNESAKSIHLQFVLIFHIFKNTLNGGLLIYYFPIE